jgi:membrane-associated protease RseP (regulator of RpoE activity)
VLAVDGVAVSTWEEVVRAVRASAGRNVTVTVKRDNQTVPVTLRPVAVKRPSLDEPGTTQTVGAVGVAQGSAFEHIGPVAAAGETFTILGEMVKGTVRVFTDKLQTLSKVYSDERDPEGFVGVIGVSRGAGEILDFQEISFGLRLANFLFLVAGVNLFVGIFNLFPLLPLDGGHLSIVGFESFRHRLERRRKARELARLGTSPAVVRTRLADLPVRRVDLNKLMPLTYAVVVLMVGLTVFIAGADIVNPIRLTQ